MKTTTASRREATATLPRLAALLLAVAAASPAAARDVELYDQPEFGGVRLTLDAATPDVAAYGLAGRVASVVVRRGQWEFCTQPRYGGACITVGPGRYGQLPPALRGTLSSFREAAKEPRPKPPGPGTPERGQPTAVLFSEEFGGERIVVAEALADLRPLNFNDTAVSVEINGPLAWELCSDGGFRGQCLRLGSGRHVLPPALRNQLSSLRPAGGGSPVTPPPAGPGGALVLFEHQNFGGRQLAANGAVPNLVDRGFNDIASSVEIRRGRWQLCAHINYEDPCTVFGPGRHVLGGPLHDAVSSLRPVFGQRDDPTPAGGALALYESFDLGGRSVLVTEATLNLRALEFNDRARSVDVYSGRWELCSDADFRGQCVVVGPGPHSLPDGLAGKLSSLRPR